MVSGARGLMFKQALNASEGSGMDKNNHNLNSNRLIALMSMIPSERASKERIPKAIAQSIHNISDVLVSFISFHCGALLYAKSRCSL
jgi:hypothetical protein